MHLTFTIGRKTILALVGIVAVSVSGMAFAAWVLPGSSGSAAAKAGSATALTLGSAPAITTGLLYPGGTGRVERLESEFLRGADHLCDADGEHVDHDQSDGRGV